MTDLRTSMLPLLRFRDSRLLAWGALLIGWLFVAYSWHRSEVGTRDILAFTAYVLLGLALPGFALWRMLVSRGTWSMLADLACGVSLAYAVELGVYFLCAHWNHPGIAFVWPVVPLAVSLLPQQRRQVWRRAETVTPAWLVALLAVLICYATSVMTRSVWDVYPITGNASSDPYVDIPYHLSLIGALSRHVPVDIPAVAGETLYYHWFVHAELAAARHASGIEPYVLLTRLGPLIFMMVAIVGVAALAYRITSSAVAGAVAPVLMVAAGGAAVSTITGPSFLTSTLFISPTTTFAMAVLIAAAGLSIELLRPGRTAARSDLWIWLALTVSLGAVSGAKGSLLPVLLAGYVAVVLMGLIVNRRIHVAGLAMLVIGGIWFEVAQKLVYGGSSQGTNLHVFDIGDRLATGLRIDHVGHVPILTAAAITGVYLLVRLTFWAGAIGLFTRDTWRDPRAWALVASGVGACGAVAMFSSDALNEVYFLLVAPPLFAVASAWGLYELARRVPESVSRWAIAVGLAVALVVGTGVWAFTREVAIDHSLARLVLPSVVTLLACIAAGGVAVALMTSRDRDHRWLVGLLVTATAISFLGLPESLGRAAHTVVTPQNQYRIVRTKVHAIIGVDGVEAARWLRDHSSPFDLVATNSHCLFPTKRAICDHRTTWISGFSERQVLLEGWSYSAMSAAQAALQHTQVKYVAYWKPWVLRANDAAFIDPTTQDVAYLHQHYGVKWLFVDERDPVDLAALQGVAHEVYAKGQYAVFQLG